MKIYAVKYPRTHDWWDGKWADLANWCDATFGLGRWTWSHIEQEFIFERESDRLMFIMRWR